MRKIRIAGLILLVVSFLILTSCERMRYDVGEGFEIYLTETPYAARYDIDYAKISFDTIALQSTPILRYSDLVKYDTLDHTLTLRISHDSLRIGEAGVYGRMFVVTIDRQPVYCGFKWSVNSSVGCQWVFIEEPYEVLDNLADNEIVISCCSTVNPDPRRNRRIMDRLKADRKIE